jgi:hypothetical protein
MASISKEFERGVTGSRPLRDVVLRVARALPMRCDQCGGRVVRTDPSAAKSCNRCGLWAD